MIIEVLDDDFIIRTFSPEETTWVNGLDEYRHQILEKNDPSDYKMLSNYTEDMLKFDDQICMSVLYHNDEILAFSTLYNRKEYGPDAARCLNRLYFDPKVRQWQRDTEHYNGYECNPRINIISPIMTEQQMSYSDYDLFFISSEPWKPRWARKIANNFSDITELEWFTDNRLYPVCCETAKSCWQHLIWHGSSELLNKGITKEEFDKRVKDGTIR